MIFPNTWELHHRSFPGGIVGWLVKHQSSITQIDNGTNNSLVIDLRFDFAEIKSKQKAIETNGV